MSDVLKPGVTKPEVWSWAMYDFANSSYSTIVISVIFNVFFISALANNAEWATLAWTSTLSVSYFISMLLMPKLGAWADKHARKKYVLFATTLGCILGTSLLGFTSSSATLWFALVAILFSNVCYSLGETFCASFLNEIATQAGLGRVSGWGWSLGYMGGIISLVMALTIAHRFDDQPSTVFVPYIMWSVALFFFLAALPLFLLLKERAQPNPSVSSHGLFRQLKESWQVCKHLTDFRWFLISTVAYQAGVAIVISLAAVYADRIMHFTMSQSILLIITVNITGAVGAFLFGYYQDKIGHQRALGITLIGWIATMILMFLSTGATLFWFAAACAGVCMGSSQSAGRAMTGYLAPEQRLAEVYALWGFAVRLAWIIGPVAYGLLDLMMNGNLRWVNLVTIVFFGAGLFALSKIDLVRGRLAAQHGI